jgi:hypothetical protein
MEVEYEPLGPRPIKRLSKDVINQIAAAEVGPHCHHCDSRLQLSELHDPLTLPLDHPPPSQRH